MPRLSGFVSRVAAGRQQGPMWRFSYLNQLVVIVRHSIRRRVPFMARWLQKKDAGAAVI
jgi:hypothetical protein